ncbi:MAG: hypothetical protein ACREP5_15840, partial [Candidatus Binatia bacterium]
MDIYTDFSRSVSKKMIAIFLLWLLAIGVNLSHAQAPFYQDKNIVVILGGPPAGSADLRTRAVITLLRKHIPGNPNI